jgi:hypothetical protein
MLQADKLDWLSLAKLFFYLYLVFAGKARVVFTTLMTTHKIVSSFVNTTLTHKY